MQTCTKDRAPRKTSSDGRALNSPSLNENTTHFFEGSSMIFQAGPHTKDRGETLSKCAIVGKETPVGTSCLHDPLCFLFLLLAARHLQDLVEDEVEVAAVVLLALREVVLEGLRDALAFRDRHELGAQRLLRFDLFLND